MIAAIILAAGASRRMGTPKARLRYRGVTFVEAIITTASRVGIEPTVVVVAPGDDKTLEGLTLGSAAIVPTENLAAGPIGSIRAGIRYLLNHPVEATLIWAVDLPHVLPTTIDALVAAHRGGKQLLSVPAFEGRRGHPVLFARGVFGELLRAPDREGARAVVRADPRRILEVPVNDPAVLEDIDTPAAYARLVAGTRP